MVTRLDLHCHSLGSDGTGTPKEFVKAVKAANLHGLVLSDHHKTITLHGWEVIKALREEGLIGLLGCEYSTKEGHCLVFGVNVEDLNLGFYPSMQDVIDRTREEGGVAFPSHPYRGIKETLGDKIFQLKNLTHAEVYNGQNEAGNGWASSARPEANQKAKTAADSLQLGHTGGSDAHKPERLGTCYTEFTGTIKSMSDLISALKAKDHQAKVNQEMVDKQKAEAKTFQILPSKWEGNWYETHPDTYVETWRNKRKSRDMDYKQLPFYSPEEDEANSITGPEDDLDYEFGTWEDHLPWIEEQDQEEDDSEDTAAIQSFLLEELERDRKRASKAARKSRIKTKSK